MNPPAVVLDCGTGFSKIGFAGNFEPTWTIPSAVGYPLGYLQNASAAAGMRYCAGADATRQSASLDVVWPVKHGLVEDWDGMERLWEACLWQYLRVNPEEHNVILTEPPLNPPESREAMAEVMFETFHVPGLYVGVQAVLALYAAFAVKEKGGTACKMPGRGLTGTVVDIGDGCTHVVPVADGYVVGGAIAQVPLAGRDVTAFVQQLLRDRGEAIPPDALLDASRRIKESLCYTCSDIVKEFGKHDAKPDKYIHTYEGVHPVTGERFSCDVAYERFLGPEVFFSPEIYCEHHRTPLPVMVDDAVQRCPIDARRRLYSNVVLSGGSTMFRDFGRRLQRDMQRLVDTRLAPKASAPGGAAAVMGGAGAPEVEVASHALQRYAAWFGGSMIGSAPDFGSVVATRAAYEEIGPSVVHGAQAWLP